jgi:hypothetical protein
LVSYVTSNTPAVNGGIFLHRNYAPKKPCNINGQINGQISGYVLDAIEKLGNACRRKSAAIGRFFVTAQVATGSRKP